LLVDDDAMNRDALARRLSRSGYKVLTADCGGAALRMIRDERIDAVLLDVMMPGMSGLETLRQLRQIRSVADLPVIMVTAKDESDDVVEALDLGANDYVTKPYSPKELRARVRALLRRPAADRTPDEIARFGDCEVDFARGELRRAGKPVPTTPLEFKLLGLFTRRAGRVLTRSVLIDEAWGKDTAITERVVDNQIANLRRKIEPSPATPRFLKSVRGIGYRFDLEEVTES
jgi:DNA-binding response OmpR family regulator